MQAAIKQVTVPHGYLRLRRVAEVGAIVIASPVAVTVGLVVALLIVAESKGGVLYAQLRPGRNGRLFRMYKFRTMCSNAGDGLAVENDRRITRVGKQLRKYRVDEIPQLWNVLRGDMSLIGPRPVPHNFYQVYNRSNQNIIQQQNKSQEHNIHTEFALSDQQYSQAKEAIMHHLQLPL